MARSPVAREAVSKTFSFQQWQTNLVPFRYVYVLEVEVEMEAVLRATLRRDANYELWSGRQSCEGNLSLLFHLRIIY